MIWVGTSGYNYPEWKGSFYPETICRRRRCCRTTPSAFRRSRSTTPSTARRPRRSSTAGARPRRIAFKLTLKAPKRITHDARLRDCGDRCASSSRRRRCSGPKLGALLFQLPPNLKKDLALFDAFLDTFPPRVRAAFEFRHPSWFDARRVRPPAGARPGAVRRRQREAVGARRDDRVLRAISGCATRATRRADIERWAGVVSRAAEGRARTSSCTSSTKRRGRGRSSAQALMGATCRIARSMPTTAPART